MANEGRDETMVRALDALLARHPTALVAAIREDGLFVDPVGVLPLASHRPVAGRSALELVVPADRVVVIEAWERARVAGGANALVHLGARPDDEVALHFLDVRSAYGVYAGVILTDTIPDGVPSAPAIPPRFGTARKNELAVLVDVDDSVVEMLGWPAEDLVGKRQLEFIHPDDQERAINNWIELLGAPTGRRQPLRVRHTTAAGGWTWVEITNTNLLGDPAHGDVLCEILDVSDEMAAHEALRAREELFRRLAETVPVGLLQVGAGGDVTYTNAQLHGILGGGPAATAAEQLAGVRGDDRAALDAAIAAVLHGGGDHDLEVAVRRPGGDERLCTMQLRALRAEAGRVTGALVCVTDITEGSRLRRELERRATYDSLTGCFNRQSVVAALDAHLASGQGTGVLYVDLDGFKEINDTFGHAAGDLVLRSVADRMQRAIRHNDLLGRLGGDEFLVVCPDVGSVAEVLAIAERLAAAVARTLPLAGRDIAPRASVGVAHAARSADADEVLARADAAMYTSKHAGEGRPVLAGTG